MMKSILLNLLFLLLFFSLSAQKPILDVYGGNLENIPLPDWIVATNDSLQADVMMSKLCVQGTCSTNFNSDYRPFSTRISDTSIHTLLPVLARYLASKIESDGLEYHLSDDYLPTKPWEVNGFGQWFANVAGRAGFEQKKHTDSQFLNEPRDIDNESFLIASFQAHKINRRWRQHFYFSASQDINKLLFDSKREDFRMNAGIGCRFFDRFAVGTSFHLSNGAFALNEYAFGLLNLSLQYNFLPYEEYFTHRFVIQLGTQQEMSPWGNTELKLLNPYIRPSIQYYRAVPWGYVNITSSAVFSSIKVLSLSRKNRRFFLSADSGFNLSKNLWLEFRVAYNHNTEVGTTEWIQLDSSDRWNSVFMSYGFRYFFGKNGQNVINPSM